MMEEVDLLVENGMIVTMNSSMEIIPEGSLAIKNGVIVDIGPSREIRQGYMPKEVLDADHCAVLPGLVNAHTHAAMTIFRGLADDLPLMEWLENYIFPAEAHLRAEWVRWGTVLACCEMLLSGTTTFCDMYLFEEEVARAAKEMGMRAIVGEVLYDFPSPNYGPIERGFQYTEELIERWKGDPLIRVAVEPHAPFTCSPELLKRARKLANSHGVPLIIHVSETKEEVDRIRASYGDTPVRHLWKLGILDGKTVADHVVWVEEEEIRVLGDAGVGVVHNPESNMKLASGVAPITEMLQAGIHVGLGTDGAASNNDLDMFREMDSAAKLHKAFSRDPSRMDASTVLRMATIGGAKALGMEDLIGSIERGKRADIILVDLLSPHFVPLHNVISHLVYSAKGTDVRSVIVDGRILVRDRRLLHVDLEEVFGEVEAISKEIRSIVRSGNGVRGR